jgi:hypothetical protein
MKNQEPSAERIGQQADQDPDQRSVEVGSAGKSPPLGAAPGHQLTSAGAFHLAYTRCCIIAEDEIRDISVAVYKLRLEQGGRKGAVERMLEKDADGGKKLRGRAESYDPLTRAYINVLVNLFEFKPPATSE